MMPRRVITRKSGTGCNVFSRKCSPKRRNDVYEPDLQFSPDNTWKKKVQIQVKVNNALKYPEIEPPINHSQSISFRLNPAHGKSLSSLEMKKKNVEVELYYNAKLQDKIDHCEPKLHVDLSYCQIVDRDMVIIVNQIILEKKCTELWLYGNHITSQGIAILAQSLVHNSTLKSLDLSFNQVSDAGVRFLALSLLPDQYSALKILYLSKNGICDDGAMYLSEMLQRNRTITELWLSNNEISNRGVKQLANVLAYHNETLKILSLSANVFITDLCIEDLLKIFEHNETLKKIWFNDCNFSEYGKMKLRERAKRKSHIHIEL
ncbi:unnamed protein product [Adineta ricciae]|uniref:Uncharacterized protein n=1 Tax=Adineta ricciae TaxID=249248 RepID=A0A814EC54_ADIRI|nr:unnamed protein product [Adineta ricciae]